MSKNKTSSNKELNIIFVKGLREHVVWHSDISYNPLLIDLQPRNLRLRVYLWNCTNPPGGRPLDEYKIQLIIPGQQRGRRGHLDYSDGRLPIIGALVRDEENMSFVLWDANKHSDFGYSSNVQVKSSVIIESFCSKIAEMVKNNKERIVCARPQYLYDAIIRRMDLMHEELLGGK